jgi:hypothetical protein
MMPVPYERLAFVEVDRKSAGARIYCTSASHPQSNFDYAIRQGRSASAMKRLETFGELKVASE